MCCGFVFFCTEEAETEERTRVDQREDETEEGTKVDQREGGKHGTKIYTCVYRMVFSGINVHLHVLYMYTYMYMYIEYYFNKFVELVYKTD